MKNFCWLSRFYFSFSLQGARGHMDGTGQRRPIHDVVLTYLHFSNFHFRNGDRLSQEPACRISIWGVSTALLSQSGFIWLFGYLQLVQLHLNLLQSKDVENLLHHEFHAGSTKPSWQFFRDSLVHVRCIPQQKFAWLFQSKCVCVCLCVCAWVCV